MKFYRLLRIQGSSHDYYVEFQRLVTGWKGQGSNPGGGGDFRHPPTTTLWPTQPPVQCVPGLYAGDKTAGAWR